jgi:hypothetical protein
MKLTTQQSYDLLEKHGSYITEICDRCGKGIGPVRFTRKDDPGVWRSRECRDGIKQKPERLPKSIGSAPVVGFCQNAKCKRGESGQSASLAHLRAGTRFCCDACRMQAQRSPNHQKSASKTPVFIEVSRNTSGELVPRGLPETPLLKTKQLDGSAA